MELIQNYKEKKKHDKKEQMNTEKNANRSERISIRNKHELSSCMNYWCEQQTFDE